MFSLRYVLAEFRRRRGRAILTAVGLGLGVALVIVVGALSRGLDDAQQEVLAPLTGVGTDMSVARPLRLEEGGEPIQLGPDGNLTPEEQALLEEENGAGGRVAFDELGEPGEPFTLDRFQTFELSFPAQDAAEVAELDGVEAVAGQLTLNLTHVEGEVPDGSSFGRPGAGGGGPGFDFSSAQVTGVDLEQPELGAVAPDEVVSGRYLNGKGAGQAVLNEAYAGREGLSVGDVVTLDSNRYTVVGLASAPLGGQASDVYVELGQLQRMSDREGRINRLRVRATDAGEVVGVAVAIESSLPGTRVTTAADLADQVEGSLVDADNLASTLGTALAAVALLAAVGLATLLTLSSVAKRTRELGTLRAIGWSRFLVVRQIVGESVAIGALGAVIGVVLGLVGALLAGALFPSLEAVTGPAADVVAGGAGGRFGLGAADDAAGQAVSVGAPIDLGLLLIGVALALLGGMVAGAIGGLRAARLSPSEAMRTVE